MSEHTGPEAAQPPPGAGEISGVPQPPAAGKAWDVAPPSSVPGGAFAPAAGPGGPWAAPFSRGAPPPPAPPTRTARVHVIWLVVALAAAFGCGTAGFLIGKSSAQLGSAIKSGAAAAGAASARIQALRPASVST